MSYVKAKVARENLVCPIKPYENGEMKESLRPLELETKDADSITLTRSSNKSLVNNLTEEKLSIVGSPPINKKKIFERQIHYLKEKYKRP